MPDTEMFRTGQAAALTEPVAAPPSLMPWQSAGPWYDALASFLGLSRQQYFYLQPTDNSWQLALYQTAEGTRCQSLSNYYSCALGPLAPAGPWQWEQCFSLLRAQHPACSRLQLEPLTDVQLNDLRHARLTGWGLISTVVSHNWSATTTNYWQQRQSQLRHTIRRKQKKLAALGSVPVIHTKLTAELQDYYWQVYQHSWKPQEPAPDFINQLLQQASAEGTLRLGLLMLDGKPVAVQCWLVANGVAAIYKLAQDKAYDALSPGTVLTAALVDYVIQHDGVSTLDFLTGNDAYKSQWMDLCRPLYQVQAFRLSRPSALLTFIWRTVKTKLQKLRFGRNMP